MNKAEAITIIRSLLSSRNSSCGIYTLNKEFKDETGIDIPLFGYSSLCEFLESIPDTIKLTGLFPIQKVSLVENETSGHIVSLVKRQKRDKKAKKPLDINNRGYFYINNRDQKFNTINNKKTKKHQNGLPSLIKNKTFTPKCNGTSAEKNFSRKNCYNIKEQAENAGEKNIVPYKNDFSLVDKKCTSSVTDESSSSRQSFSSELESLTIVDSEPLPRISDCFVRSAEKMPKTDLRLHAKVGHYVEVYPCEIFHPGHFYLHLRELKKKLSRFMHELQEFYNEHEEIPPPSQTPKQDQVYAVRYSRQGGVALWYRVQVEEILSSCLVVVRFVDYGTTAKILVKNLKLLHLNFITFPRQAVLGSLANIKPPGGRLEWSKPATRRFHELAFCRDLVGGVVSINYEKCSLSVALSSTVGEEVHVNDTLVEEGLAVFGVDVLKEIEEEESVKEHNLPSPASYSKIAINCISKNRRLHKMFTVGG